MKFMGKIVNYAITKPKEINNIIIKYEDEKESRIMTDSDLKKLGFKKRKKK